MGKIIRNGITYGGGSDEIIQCTQAQYDAWEQAGTLDPTKAYFITDASSGSSLIDDSTTSQTKTWSSDKIDDEKVSKSGDTMTGDLRIDSTSSASSTSDGAGISWKETGYGDKFEIKPAFGGVDDANYLAIKTATGGAGTDPDTTDKFKFYPSGRLEVSGAPVNANDVWRKCDFSGGKITNVDLNTLIEQKNYYLAGVSSANHAPWGDFWGVLEVIQQNVTLQRATQVGSEGPGLVIERIYFNGAWTSWVVRSGRPIWLVAQKEVQLPANTVTLVEFSFTVPTNYSIVTAQDDTYYAGVLASCIRINQGSGTKVVSMNYLSNYTQTRKWLCRALALPNVDVRSL